MLFNRAKSFLKGVQYNANETLDSLIQIKIRNDLIAASKHRLLAAKNYCLGQTVFCIGNGPSLNEEQVSLASNYPFIATNRAYQLFESTAFRLGGQGWLMINDNMRSLEILPSVDLNYQQVVVGCHNPNNIYLYKFLMRHPWIFANCSWQLQLSSKGIRCIDLSHQQHFSADFAKSYCAGWSVIFSAIQLAAFLGAKQIILVGCDMDYSGQVQYSNLIRNDRLSIGHLGRFDYDEHGKPHMISCRNGLAALGIKIYNASPSGAINEIPRISPEDLQDFLKGGAITR